MEKKRDIVLNVNDKDYELSVPVRYTLADVLRDELGLTGTHLACEHGFCGACTVMVNGRSARSCLALAVSAHGSKITTIEGLSSDGNLNSLQQAFHDCHSLQCGFCTPGFLITATELLCENPTPTEVEIKDAISGNICRCTGYKGIVDAIKKVSDENKTVAGRA